MPFPEYCPRIFNPLPNTELVQTIKIFEIPKVLLKQGTGVIKNVSSLPWYFLGRLLLYISFDGPSQKKVFFTIFDIYVAERSVCVWLRNQQGGVPHNTFTFPPPSQIRFSDQQEDYYMYVHYTNERVCGTSGSHSCFCSRINKKGVLDYTNTRINGTFWSYSCSCPLCLSCWWGFLRCFCIRFKHPLGWNVN